MPWGGVEEGEYQEAEEKGIWKSSSKKKWRKMRRKCKNRQNTGSEKNEEEETADQEKVE